jgi:hypothetical protein
VCASRDGTVNHAADKRIQQAWRNACRGGDPTEANESGDDTEEDGGREHRNRRAVDVAQPLGFVAKEQV